MPRKSSRRVKSVKKRTTHKKSKVRRNKIKRKSLSKKKRKTKTKQNKKTNMVMKGGERYYEKYLYDEFLRKNEEFLRKNNGNFTEDQIIEFINSLIYSKAINLQHIKDKVYNLWTLLEKLYSEGINTSLVYELKLKLRPFYSAYIDPVRIPTQIAKLTDDILNNQYRYIYDKFY